jgi:membrane protease YdiL (CAAX protease family)
MISEFEYKPLRYFSITFAATFILWFIGAYMSFQEDSNGLHMVFLLAGLVAPFLISLAMIFGSGRPDLKRDFIDRLINPRRIRPASLPSFIFIMPLSVAASILISLQFGGSVSQFQLAEGFSFSSGFVPVLLLLVLAATFEELGWRGYAFDSLQSRYSFFMASLIFSVLWSLWHFPLVFVKDSYQYEIFNENILFGLNFFVSIVPMGIIISWICIKNRKSVLAAILFHFIINMSQEALEISQVTKCIQTVVLLLTAGVIIAMEKELFFSKGHLAGVMNRQRRTRGHAPATSAGQWGRRLEGSPAKVEGGVMLK